MGDGTTEGRARDTAVEMAVARHRLLSEPTRVRILLALKKDGPATVQDMAELIGVHANTIRAHLPRLQQAGLLRAQSERAGPRGRPRIVYRLSDDAALPDGAQRNYRALAEVLLGMIRLNLGERASDAATATGVAWGKHVAGRDAPLPGREADPATAVDYLTNVFESMGFSSRLAEPGERWLVEIDNCPYKELAQDNQDIVCSFHLGLVRGVLDTLGGQVEAESLDPLVEPGLCRVSLTPADRNLDGR